MGWRAFLHNTRNGKRISYFIIGLGLFCIGSAGYSAFFYKNHSDYEDLRVMAATIKEMEIQLYEVERVERLLVLIAPHTVARFRQGVREIAGKYIGLVLKYNIDHRRMDYKFADRDNLPNRRFEALPERFRLTEKARKYIPEA